MGFTEQSGTLGFRAQSVQGTFPADFATAAVSVRRRSGTLGPNRDLMITDPEIGGGRDVVDAYLGAVSWSGEYEFYLRYETIATLLYAALGLKSSATTTGVSTHTITPADTTALPWYGIEEKQANGYDCIDFVDAKCNTFHMESDANGYLMGTAGWIARQGTAGITAANISSLVDNSPMSVGTNISITYNGVTLPAKSFSLDINNNLETDDFRMGSFLLGDVTEKRREVTMGLTLRPQDSTLWRQAVFGTSSATTPGGIVTKQQVVLTITSYEDIVGGTPATKNSCTITIPSAAIVPFTVAQSGDDVLQNDITIRALRPSQATPIMTAVVKNAKTAVA